MYNPDKQREDAEVAEITGVDTCLGCSKAIIHTKGKKKRKWCSDACRVATARRLNPNTKSEQIKSEQPITNKPNQGVTDKVLPHKLNLMADVINQQIIKPERTAQGMTEVFEDKGRHKIVSDAEFTKLMAKAGHGHIRVSKPGDPDYFPQCETTKAFVEGRPKDLSTAKRGDVQTVIDGVTEAEPPPDRFYSTGTAI